MNRDDNNLEFKICLGLIILMMLMVTWFYMDVKEACAAETTDGTYYPDITEIDLGEYEETIITVSCSGKDYDIPLEGYKYYFVAYDTSGYAKIFITNTPLTGTENKGDLTIAAAGVGDVLTYGVSNVFLDYEKTRSLYAECAFNFGVSSFKYHDSNYNFKDSETGEILYAANSSSASGFEEINCGDYAEQLADIVNVCDRMYVVQYIGFDGLVRTRYCFLRPSTIANIISSGKVLSGCTYYLPYDYAVTVYEHTVQSVTTMSGTQAFYKTDDITAYMFLGATFDIDLISILPNYNYNKYGYPAAPEPEEPDEPVVDYTPPTTQELLDALPAEAKFYTDCIILQQEHEDAWTNDIVFYCWNVPDDEMIYLILRWGDSAVLAADSDGVLVTGTLKGYWDFATASWVIDAGTIISRTRNSTYSVPKIYYSSANLYRQILSQSENLHDTDSCLFYWISDNPEDLVDDPFGAIIEEKGWWTDLKRFFYDMLIPKEGYFQRKVYGMTNKFKFFRSIVDTANFFYDFMTTTDFSEPPVLTMDLSASTSSYDYGTSAIALDMSWYAPYKPSVDVLLSSVLWLVFAWNTFKALPSIIRGAGLQIFASTDISGKDDTK